MIRILTAISIILVLNLNSLYAQKTSAFDPISAISGHPAHTTVNIEKGFFSPPDLVKPWAYWFWIFNRVDKEGITRDLEEFRAKGIGGVVLLCGGGYGGKERQENGPDLLSPEWHELFKHALKEAARLNINVGFNMAGSWVMFGPWVTKDNAMKHVVQSKLILKGSQKFIGNLPHPEARDDYYRDVTVQAFRLGNDNEPLKQKTEPVCVSSKGFIDLTNKLKPNGQLEWDVPAGQWLVLRTGYTLTGKKWIATDDIAPGSGGYEIDFMNPSSFDDHFKHLGEAVLKDTGPLVGKTLTFLWTDSFEAGNLTWTQAFPAQFLKYRGYDLKPYLPVLSGYVVDNAEVTARFKADLGRTIMDCLADNCWGRFAKVCHEHGLKMGSEASSLFNGPPPMDGLKNLGRCDIPSGELWAEYTYKYPKRLDGYNFNCKQTASAAHIYGKKQALAEAFTTQGSDTTIHWGLGPSDLKPFADIAFCEGINHLMLHEVTCLRPKDGKPGYELCAGTHFSPNITWWQQSGPFFSYLARCQYLLQQGLFVGDVCYYLGDNPPVTVLPKHIDPSLGTGYDCDYCNTEVLLTRMSVKNGRIVLPDGMSYRVLSLPPVDIMSPQVVKMIGKLVKAGATVIGQKPVHSNSLTGYPDCDVEVRQVANQLWGDCDGENVKERKVGKGRIIWGMTLREILLADGVKPDFEYGSIENDASMDFIHRSVNEMEIYFVSNRNNRWEKQINCTFRVSGKQPEIWDPVNGEIREAKAFVQADGRTTLPLEFTPYGSTFIVFRKPISSDISVSDSQNYSELIETQKITGPWTVSFNPAWGGPKSIQFEELISWTKRQEDGIKYYSGTATYTKRFDLNAEASKTKSKIILDLGNVKNIATVRLNGKNTSVLWTTPWRVDITAAVKPEDNVLEIDVVNVWANRVIGDLGLPKERRLTRTHDEFRFDFISKNSPIRESGLLGPVTLKVERE